MATGAPASPLAETPRGPARQRLCRHGRPAARVVSPRDDRPGRSTVTRPLPTGRRAVRTGVETLASLVHPLRTISGVLRMGRSPGRR